MSQSCVFLFSFCYFLLLIRDSSGCLPTGFGGLFGGGKGGCASSPAGCGAAPPQYAAPMPPPIYSFSPQIFQQPLPPPPPPAAPAAAPAAVPPSSESAYLSAASSYQGMYQDKPHAPSVNPDYQGRAPLSFVGEVASSEDAANTIIDPLKYIEHVSVSHTPAVQIAPPVQEAYPPGPADPFSPVRIQTETQQHQQPPTPSRQQIQVAPSSAAKEDTYLPGPPENDTGVSNSTMNLNTYYNQMCTGEKIATGEKETINSATKKCELLKCVAANAQPDSHGSYTVTYLRTATSRSNSKGNYCLSSKDLPAKSKRVIRKLDEMLANEETNRVRRKIFKL